MKLTQERLAELKAASLPRMKAADIAQPKEDSPEAREYMRQLDEYLTAFVPPGDGKCICCGAQQGGSELIDVILGKPKFRWGLAHGEGTCSDCGYPARAMHYIGKGEDEITIRNFILQYHPDELSFNKQEETKAEVAS